MFRPVSPSSAGSTRSRWRCPGTNNHDPSSADNDGESGAQRWHWHGGCISILGRSSPQSLSIAVHTMSAASSSSALWLSSTARSLTAKQDAINPTQQSVDATLDTCNLEVSSVASMSRTTPQTTPAEADTHAEDRVHHHARVGDRHEPIEGGILVTLCGLQLPGPRPGAAELPCCPMCALSMGKPCT